jgi:hypothetical protein
MASRLAMGLVLVSALALATYAQAGFSINNPLTAGECGPMDASADMGNPNAFSISGFGITVKQCVAACRAAIAECKQTAKLSFGCQVNVNARDTEFHAEACVVDDAGNPANIKACVTSVRDGGATNRISLRSSLLTDLGNCDTWGATCMTDCLNIGL